MVSKPVSHVLHPCSSSTSFLVPAFRSVSFFFFLYNKPHQFLVEKKKTQICLYLTFLWVISLAGTQLSGPSVGIGCAFSCTCSQVLAIWETLLCRAGSAWAMGLTGPYISQYALGYPRSNNMEAHSKFLLLCCVWYWLIIEKAKTWPNSNLV